MYPAVQFLHGDVVDRVGAFVAEQAERSLPSSRALCSRPLGPRAMRNW